MANCKCHNQPVIKTTVARGYRFGSFQYLCPVTRRECEMYCTAPPPPPAPPSDRTWREGSMPPKPRMYV